MITQNEIALKILNMGKEGYKNDADGFKKINQANDLIEKHVQEQLRLYGVVSEFFCEDEDLEYSSKKCKEQCDGCKWIENL
jgi:3-dehydroquinate synthase class II